MNSIEKEFVPYQESLELKELGFDEPCLVSWNFYTNEFNYNASPSTFTSEDVIQLPTFSQAFRWFREKHGWVAEIHGAPQHNHFYANVLLQAKGELGNSKICDTYEEAELVCLRKLIELVKNTKP